MSDQPKKLIEVALPLDEINAASAAYKGARVGTIRNLHKWFAAMPAPAWRALLYAALIDDPGNDLERAEHLEIMKRLVGNGVDLPDDEAVSTARRRISSQFPDGPPVVMDPFCGGGSTLVEARRLGLETFASDLNPVPVLITRSLTALLPAVWGEPSIHADQDGRVAPEGTLLPAVGRGAPNVGFSGLAADVEFYAMWVRDCAWAQVKVLYESAAKDNPTAWIWARTLACPNPICGIETVLTTSWWLSKKRNELAWIEPHVSQGKLDLKVVTDQSIDKCPEPPKAGRGASFTCTSCTQVMDEDYVVTKSAAGALGLRLMAVVFDHDGSRRFRAPLQEEIEACSAIEPPSDVADVSLGPVQRYVSPPRFGLHQQRDLYTARQLCALTALADAIALAHSQIIKDGGTRLWADAVTTLLGLTLGKVAQNNSSQTRWKTSNASGGATAQSAFGRNDLPMTWDFAETNPFGTAVGAFVETTRDQLRTLKYISVPVPPSGSAVRFDARTVKAPSMALVATDPPYYDAIGYADLSDYFYVWHRLALRTVHPDLYATVAAPKEGELTAMPAHHGNSRDAARRYFTSGFTQTFENLQESMHPEVPMVVVYASKEQKGDGEEETRWASILTAMVDANLEITGTWPIHGTSTARMIGQGTNAVATYVVMVCRPRSQDAETSSLSDFNRAMRRELPPAVHALQAAGVLPVDLAQAAMGPGMQIYSRYKAVLDQSGTRVSVDTALRLINQALGEVLDEQEGELDPASRFAITLWEKHHWGEAPFGEADQVARPQGISVDDVIRSHVASFPRAGFVTLLGRGDMDRGWSPKADARPTAWEAVHHLADRLIDGRGVSEAGALMAELGVWRDQAQALVYRLHAIAARKGWTEDQERYNALIGSWSDLLAEAGRVHDNGDGLF